MFEGDNDYIIKDKYKLTNHVKGGAFGEVFFAKHLKKNYEVAIKFVSLLNNKFRASQAMKKRNVSMIMKQKF